MNTKKLSKTYWYIKGLLQQIENGDYSEVLELSIEDIEKYREMCKELEDIGIPLLARRAD